MMFVFGWSVFTVSVYILDPNFDDSFIDPDGWQALRPDDFQPNCSRPFGQARNGGPNLIRDHTSGVSVVRQ